MQLGNHFRFAIKNGQVTYQCRLLRSETFNKSMTANRIVFTQFGTKSVPDPCHSIFQRYSVMIQRLLRSLKF